MIHALANYHKRSFSAEFRVFIYMPVGRKRPLTDSNRPLWEPPNCANINWRLWRLWRLSRKINSSCPTTQTVTQSGFSKRIHYPKNIQRLLRLQRINFHAQSEKVFVEELLLQWWLLDERGVSFEGFRAAEYFEFDL